MFLHDLRQAIRAFRRSPSTVAAGVGLLALGIGSVTAVFSVVNGVLLRSLPYRDAERLVVALDEGQFPVSPANFLDLREQGGSFEELAAAEIWGPTLRGTDQVEQVPAVRLSANMFRLLGAQALLGRVMRPDEERDRVVVLSHALWQRRFGGDPGIPGRTIMLNGDAFTIVGVMPAGFQFPPFWATSAELWAPLDLASRRDDRAGASLRLFGRLSTGRSVEQAQAEARAISARLVAAYPEANRRLNLRIVPLHEMAVGRVRPMLALVLAASGFVLLIACANVATLLLARATGRRKEIAIRTAIGAARTDVVRQLLVESGLHALVGGALGLLLAYWSLRALVALAPSDIPRIDAIALDGSVLVGALGLSLAAGMISGLAPALGLATSNLQPVLRDESGGASEGKRSSRLRNLLVAGEVALALMLTIGAGLLVRSFVRLATIDPGFDPRNLITMTVSVSGTAHLPEGRRLQFFDELQRNVSALPGVRSVALINHLPLAGDTWGMSASKEGDSERGPRSIYRVVEPGYFATMQVRLLEGRDFSIRDDASAPSVIIVNRALAQHHWPGQSAVGKRLTLDHPQKNPLWATVVGVAADVKQAQWSAESAPEIYLPFRQSTAYLSNPAGHYAMMTLVVRGPAGLSSSIRGVIRQLDKDAPISHPQTMDEVIATQMARPRFAMLLVAAFGSVALVLALIGVYCVVAYGVGRRTREIGIRMALGADRSTVVRMVVLETGVVILPGLAAGCAAALALSHLISTMLYGISPRDTATFVEAVVAFAMMILAAVYLPARRASRVDPSIALRQG